MKEIDEMRSGLVALYPANAIPIDRIVAVTGEGIKEGFGFNAALIKEGELEFSHGRVGDTTVMSAAFGPRRAKIVIEGTSDQADAVLAEFMGRIFEGADPPDPLVVAPETTTISVLDFDWAALYSPALAESIDETINASATGGIVPRVADPSVTLMLKFQTPAELDDHGIELSAKLFRIAPVAKAPLKERRYMVTTPTRSDDHLRILEQLESRARGGGG